MTEPNRYDELVAAFLAGVEQLAKHNLYTDEAEVIASRADAYARSRGFAPAPPPPERRVVRLRQSLAAYSWRVSPNASLAASQYPFEHMDHANSVGWVHSRFVARDEATEGTVLGELLKYPNKGDVPEPTPTPPLPAITDEQRKQLSYCAKPESFSYNWLRPIYAWLVQHAPSKVE